MSYSVALWQEESVLDLSASAKSSRDASFPAGLLGPIGWPTEILAIATPLVLHRQANGGLKRLCLPAHVVEPIEDRFQFRWSELGHLGQVSLRLRAL